MWSTRRRVVLTAFLGLALLALDRGLGVLFPAIDGLALTPGSQFTCATDEYRFAASVNDRGFRGRSLRLGRGPVRRIVALGDSYTFGWGVEDGETWPAQLEARLGGGAEVANLGRPEAGPVDYVRVAEKALPLLRPDLIVLAVSQGDDLFQAGPRPDERDIGRRAVSRGLRLLAPTLTALVRDRRPPLRLNEGEHRDFWGRIAERTRAEMTADERGRFEALDEGIRLAFLEGRLDPRLMWRSAHQRDFFTKTLHLDRADGRRAVLALAADLARIRSLATRAGARVVLVPVPLGVYVSQPAFDSARRLGFDTEDAMLTAFAPEDAVRAAAASAGIPCVLVTQAFREQAGQARLFYELDGRLSPAGHRLLADLVLPLVRESLGR